MERNLSLLNAIKLEVFDEQVTQPVGRDEMRPGAEEAEESRERVERENLSPADPVPNLCELVGCCRCEGARSDKAPFTAPTEVPTMKSGSIPRSYKAPSIPTWIAPRAAPPERTKAVWG